MGDRYEAEAEAFWKMNHNPVAFEKARDVLKQGKTMPEAQIVYIDAIYGKDAGYDN